MRGIGENGRATVGGGDKAQRRIAPIEEWGWLLVAGFPLRLSASISRPASFLSRGIFMPSRKTKTLMVGGHAVLIDEEDAPLVMQRQWWATVLRRTSPDYVHIGAHIDGRWTPLGRFLLGAQKGEHVDHINGDTLDNRRSNLRLCTHQENMRNSRPEKNSTGYPGVYRSKKKGRFGAKIYVDGKPRHLGTYDSAEEAFWAYLEAKERLHPTFARKDEYIDFIQQ